MATVKYKLVLKKDMTKAAKEGDKLYYPQAVSGGRVSFEELCEEIAEQSSLTSGDIKNAIDRLVLAIAKHLATGQSVDCGDMGSFRFVLRSAGAKTEKDYNAAAHMRRPGVIYYPGRKILEAKEKITFERVAAKPAGTPDESDSESPDEI